MTTQDGRVDYEVTLVEDRPSSGMWHCGPNAAWVTVTHLPTMISARAFDLMHHRAKQAAQACCEMMVEQTRLLKCQFPERVRDRDRDPEGDETPKSGSVGEADRAWACKASPNPSQDNTHAD